MEDHIQYIEQDGAGALVLLDQRRLPTEEVRFTCRTVSDIVCALRTMVVRGAPAIGVSAAFGCAIAVQEAAQAPDWKTALDALLTQIEQARPTAVNLSWAVARMRALASSMPDASAQALYKAFAAEARRMQAEDIASCRAIGQAGLACIPENAVIMTHCNAGALATAGYGTALGVIRAAFEAKRCTGVIANETRPFLQGARLTAWELHRDGIPVTVACDNACSLLMSRGMVSCVVVGADRIAANGDTANKIGTSGVAILARHYGVPFYIAAPASTFDAAASTGADIPIEQRPASEVTHVGSTRITPEGVPVYNFAFDVTPARFITGIITDRGLLLPPYADAIARILNQRS